MPESKTKVKTIKPEVAKVNKSSVKPTTTLKSTTTAKTVKTTENKSTGLIVKVYDTAGKAAGTVKLPEKTFGAKINKALLTQALRVYFTNSHTHTAHTKTRTEVRGGGRKPWKQKGTGNARAGSKRSPLWVGGGITFGPRTRDVKLHLPKKMKQAALVSALSSKAQDGNIAVVANFEKIQPKTKIMSNLIIKSESKSPILLIVSEKNKNINLASRNIPQTIVETVENLNAYLIWNNKNILISKEALAKFS